MLSSSLGCMPTRLQVNCVPEATAYNKLELVNKKMMSLCCSSISSHRDGQVISKKFLVVYSLIRHLEELTIENGINLKDTRIVIPAKKWEAVLKLIHEGHLGLNKCKLCAKETAYWPGLNYQLEKHILNCDYVWNIHNQNASGNLPCRWDRRFHYTLGPS